MTRLTPAEARDVFARAGVDRDSDFHALRIKEVVMLLREADRLRYRAPRNANGSRARYFHAYLTRTANRKGA